MSVGTDCSSRASSFYSHTSEVPERLPLIAVAATVPSVTANVRFGSPTSWSVEAMSALPPKADIRRGNCDVCFVPKADIHQYQTFKWRSKEPH
jgi:hypothetical protein